MCKREAIKKFTFCSKKMSLREMQNQQLQISTPNLQMCIQSHPFHQGNKSPRSTGQSSHVTLKNVSHSDSCFSFRFKSELAVTTYHVSTQAVSYSRSKSSLRSPTFNMNVAHVGATAAYDRSDQLFSNSYSPRALGHHKHCKHHLIVSIKWRC